MIPSRSGDFTAGDRFPSERDLAERYEVSRATANKVISALVAEGLLELQKGIGTRIRKQKPLFASLDGMESFTRQARAQGLNPETQVLKFEQIAASKIPAVVQRGLGLYRRTDETRCLSGTTSPRRRYAHDL